MGLRKIVGKTIAGLVRWAQGYEYDNLSTDVTSPPAGPAGRHTREFFASKSLAPIRNYSGGVNPASIGNENFGMNFTVYSANGGKVIQISSYDPRTDKSTTALHIITDKEDLGVELGMIITRESLSR